VKLRFIDFYSSPRATFIAGVVSIVENDKDREKTEGSLAQKRTRVTELHEFPIHESWPFVLRIQNYYCGIVTRADFYIRSCVYA
jgi:hypothetical protein